jgi:pimeloyl-ACP methyl ester carboxylesterase
VTAGSGVLLLHGYGRFGTSMAPLARAARREGYGVLAPTYRSRRPMAEIVARLMPRLAAFEAAISGRLHIVTHSLGSLVALIAARRPRRLGRVVMLSPPHGGSEIADLLHRARLGPLVLGKAAAQLRTRRTASDEALLGEVDYDLGIIAGDRPMPFPTFGALPKPHDGEVSVAATRVIGMCDQLVLPVGHTLILHDRLVADATLGFLASGHFPR